MSDAKTERGGYCHTGLSEWDAKVDILTELRVSDTTHDDWLIHGQQRCRRDVGRAGRTAGILAGVKGRSQSEGKKGE